MKGSLLFSLLMAAFSCGVAAQGTECDKSRADIVFLVDSSKSIGLNNFEIIRSFIKIIIEDFDIGPNKVQFGLAQYDSAPYKEFLLKDHAGKTSMLDAVDKIPWRQGSTNTGQALKFLQTNYFTKEAGSRAEQKVPQIALVITDGISNDDVKMPAERLRKHGVTIFSIGVGGLHQKDLHEMASLPPERFVLSVDTFQTLEKLKKQLLNKVCNSVEDQTRAQAETFQDIFFLVDSSIVPGEFSKFQSELIQWVTIKDIESSKHRLGLAQYSDNPKVAFFLNAFQTKQQTLDGVKSFKLDRPARKPSNLGKAIEQANTQYFTPEVGGRAHLGNPKSLVVVVKEKPYDPLSWSVRQAENDGVKVFAIAAGATQDILDLIVSGRRGYPGPGWSRVPGFILPQEMIVISEDCKGANVADIVFIVAESTSIGITNYRLIRTFLHSIVGSLDIGQNRVRVGIVTYGDNATAQIYLNTFNEKDEILQFVKTMSYNGGDRNTGAALKFARENLFVEQRGSRKDVQQVAVVITDGQSQDSVGEEATALRRAGVTVYAVGIANASESELLEMVSHPPYKHIFNVESFSKLRPLQQTLQKTMCFNIIDQAIVANTRSNDIKGACVQKDEADFFFLMDDSGSIQNQDFDDMKKFIIEFLHTFRIGPKYNRMGLVKYADSPRLQVDLDTHSNAKDIEEAVKKVLHEGGGTNTGKALSFMKRQFKKAAESRRHEVPVYLIVITDGKSADKVKAPAEDLRAQGVITFAIGVKEANRNELLDIAGSPDRTFFVSNFDALKLLNKDVFADLCTPDACKDSTSDIFFLTDSSGHISAKEYQTMKDFMKSVIRKSNIGRNQVHVGVMQFSANPDLVFPLNSYYSQEEMSKAIDDMQQMSDGTHTGKAIAEASKQFELVRGGRPDIRQSLILITNNKAIDEVIGPVAALGDKGVVVYAIGVVDANFGQLLEISGSPERVFNERNFDALKDLENQLAVQLCDPKHDCKKIKKADVIFLIDVSTTIDTTEFGSMQIFMESVVNQSTVGANLTRFGVIVYSTNPASVFTLKEYDSKREVLSAIGKVVPSGGDTYTGKALTYSLQYFKAEHGGRKQFKVPQILMVITDGDATNPHNLKKPSDTLRANGVTVFSIGVKDAKKDQLNTIAGGDKSKVFYVDNFKALEPLYKKISGVLCNYTKPVCEKEKADLVFLLDQSSSISTENYEIQRNFTIDLIRSFEISQEYVHVGLAQFSDVPQHEFYLNTYSQVTDMISHLRHMERFGVETYLGRALVFIKDYFKTSHGSRSGLSKNLIVISDGNSRDDVEDAGEDLRDLGVEVFAVGVGDVHDLELLQITGTPERLFNARNFRGLENIKKEIIDRICTSKLIPDPPGCSIDIAVGFDISRRTGAPGEKLIRGQLRTLLPEIVHYLSSVQGLCCLSPTRVKTSMAFQVFDRNGRPLYSTNFDSYSEDVVRKVMDLPMSEPTYFNTTMLKASRDRFQTSGAGVKVLLIFSDGLDEDVKTLEPAVELLQQSGVSALLTVALEGTRDPAQLQMVEFGRGFGNNLPLRITTPRIGDTILKQIVAVSNRECCNVTCECWGPEGVRGSRGRLGSKGGPGRSGQPGFLGEDGVAGGRGPPGLDGLQGIQGCAGDRGQKGNRGVSGSRGNHGEDGLDGINGEQGLTGLDGAQGERGHPGKPGIPGIRGEAGLKGQLGLRGDPGETGTDNTVPGARGEPGNPGLPGAPGPDGLPGESGVTGNPGLNGRPGSVAEKGSTGGPGDRGLPGSPGVSGPQGSRGGNGEPGPKGLAGFPGPQGAPGPAGDPGLSGRRGANGQKGQPGPPGVKGAAGSQGPRGAQGLDGRDGFGPTGPKGVKGDPGFPGYPGQMGEDGLQGTKGDPGRKGNQGRAGNSGVTGPSGVTGDPGYPGHRGPRGSPGSRTMTDCEQVSFIRDHCVCSHGRSACPAYPTELVFSLDMSKDVTPAAFERQRSALLSLLDDISVAESNCPTGARVAVVGYSTFTKYLIRFQDYHRKKQLIESVKNIALDRTTNGPNLGAAMRFVGQNVFKRVRAGAMMRKVAVFFANGPPQDISGVVTAVMEYRARNIVPAVISLRNAPALNQALEVDDSGKSIFMVLGRNTAADLRKVKNCAVCYDPCKRSEQCAFIQDVLRPQEADLDLAMVVDSSREVQADEYTGVQQLLGSVVEQLAVSTQPRRAGNRARVAVVQQSGTQVSKPEFGLQTYQTPDLMRRHLTETMQQQGGSSELGQTLEFTLNQVLLDDSQPRKRRALLAVVGTQTSNKDRAKLRYMSQKAKCEGVALFVVTVGDRYSRTEVEELASAPVQQHLIHLGRLRAEEQGYAQRFFRVFLNVLNKGINSYPPPSLKRTCDQLKAQDRGRLSRNGRSSSGSEVRHNFQELMEGQTPLDGIHTGTRGDGQRSPPDANDACFLSEDAGGCQNYTMMWFFDSHQQKCSRFWYGGCGGNENRFKKKKDCESVCVTRVQ